MTPKTHATLQDFHAVEGKAELVKGERVFMSPTGRRPARAAGKM